jgi:hypothetical protein
MAAAQLLALRKLDVSNAANLATARTLTHAHLPADYRLAEQGRTSGKIVLTAAVLGRAGRSTGHPRQFSTATNQACTTP